MSNSITIDALRAASAYIKEADEYRLRTTPRTTTTVDTLLMREQNALLRANHAILTGILSDLTGISR